MNLETLEAISPIDGRYRYETKEISEYFSEYSLIKYRVLVEVEYFIAMCEFDVPQLHGVDKNLFAKLRGIYENFSTEDFKKAYTKFRAIIADEKSLKKGQPVNFATLRGELDRNPGKPENMILNIFFNFAAEEAKKGRTSRSHMDALKANAE